ncbi:hypothetical protein LINGRAHAP2_LOCUS5229, partial [Linum grandiflorum]
ASGAKAVPLRSARQGASESRASGRLFASCAAAELAPDTNKGIIRSRCRLEELPGPTRRCLTSMRSLIVRGTKEELRDELLFYFIISNTTIWDFAEF